MATQGVTRLDFVPEERYVSVDPRKLLVDQRVPAWQLTTVPEALRRAPPGSLILACWRSSSVVNFWGPCSHIARKLDERTLAESISPVEGGAGLYPLARLNDRYAIIVIDSGVREHHLAKLRAEAERLDGRPYSLSGDPGTLYCSTYQNELQRALGLPEAVPYSDIWKVHIPAEALLQPGARVLLVGVNSSVTRQARRIEGPPRE